MLAERAWNDRDWAAAAKYYGVLADGEGATPAELDRLAVALARTERYREAAAAWHRAELANPIEANHPRYMMRVANMAAALGGLPETAPSGAAWTSLGKEELATIMKEQADAVRRIREEARAEEPLSKERQREHQASVDAARPVFVAAALHYGLAGYGLRETAFFGGYAPLIFRSREWIVPEVTPPSEPPPRRQRKVPAKATPQDDAAPDTP
jgi:hypothetical protein